MKSVVLKCAWALVALLCVMECFSQTSASPVRKKTVYRVIELIERERKEGPYLKSMGERDTTLLELFTNAIYAGQLTAYSVFEPLFSDKISKQTFIDDNERLDTIPVLDPVSGKEVLAVKKTVTDYSKYQRYRVMEDWTFDPRSGKTDINIVGIAPFYDLYAYDGSLRGQKIMFWLKYKEALPSISRYDQLNPERTFASYIWNDYFLSELKPRNEK